MKDTVNPFQVSLAALLFGGILLASDTITVRAANVLMTTNDANGATTSFNSAGKWSNSQAPSAANDYFTAGYLLRTPNTAAGSSNYFAGNSLSLDFNPTNMLVGLSMKYAGSSSARVDNLKLNGGAIFNGQGATMSFYGNFTVLTNSFLDPQANGRILAIYAPISGGSTNTIGIRAAAGSAGGIVQLLGDNSGYAGKWYIWGVGDSVPGAVLQIGNGGTSGNLGMGRVTNNYSLIFNRSDLLAVSNIISGSGCLIQAGSGALTLAATNTYSGNTTNNAGTLILAASGSIASSPMISLAAGSTFDVSAVAGFGLATGQVLTGSGSVVGSVASVAGATISVGDATSGTLTINGDVTLGNCLMNFNLNTPNVVGGTNSLLVVNGNLTLNPTITLNFTFPNGNPIAGTYTLCQCTGNLTGSTNDFITSLGTNTASFSLNTAASPRTITLTISGSSPPPATNSVQIIKVYLEAGQSNADGRAVTNGLPVNLIQPQNSVPFYYYLTGGAANADGTLGTLTTLRPGCSAIGGGTTFGPELTLGNTLANYYAVSNGVTTNTIMVALIKYAHGGTSLVANWAATGAVSTNGDGPDYLIFQQVVKTGLARLAAAYPAASIELDGMIWVQGETDIDGGVAPATAYGTNLIRFINDVRLKLSSNQPYGMKLPFFFSRISAQQTYYSLPTDASYSNYLLLRAGQNYAAATLSNSNVFMLDIDGSQFTTLTPYASPGLHFDTAGQQALGAAFGQAVRTALPASSMSAPAQSGNGWSIVFAGVTATTHSVQRAPVITGPWTLLTNIVMNPLGYTNYADQNPPTPAAFYRVSRP
jgi:autotransporter-associated beta strand protein